ncbi:hypothetical protein AB0I28_02885 [Phytomonospora sp. NPDC050363]|uniref:YqeB family protein n=1 Tax=Phytomonospora sp. NPDC050363 TaxID=3155642 RepID=UPI0033F661D5
MSSQDAPGGRTKLTDPLWQLLIMWIGLPVAGALAVWGLKLIAGWVAGLSWAPFQGVFELAADVPDPQATIGALGIGAVGGLVLAAIGQHETLSIVFEDDALETTKDGRTRTFARNDVDRVCLSGKELIVFSADGGELLREKTEADPARLAAAFRAKGYAWEEGGDPYAERFKRWVPGVEGLPPGADALLKARQKARDKDDAGDCAELRDELAEIGVVVRDDKKRQYWRPSGKDPRP